jgi:hypothetical protein
MRVVTTSLSLDTSLASTEQIRYRGMYSELGLTFLFLTQIPTWLLLGKIGELDHVRDIITSPAFYGFPFATSK